MGTVANRIQSWRKKILRWTSQINNSVVVLWYQEGLEKFEKELLAYASWKLNTSFRYQNITANTSDYTLPLWVQNAEDFYSIIQLRVAFDTDKNGTPIYRICTPINIGDYNTLPKTAEHPWYQIGAPVLKHPISKLYPRYVFVNKNTIKIFPTPDKTVTWWFQMVYNFMPKEIATDGTTDESTLNLPRYFFDAIEDYMSYCLVRSENPELAWEYLAAFDKTVHDNIYWLNRDQRANEEEFANLAYYRIR